MRCECSTFGIKGVTVAKLLATVDDDVKKQAAALYESLGMSLSTAVNVFLRQSVYENGMPFEPRRAPRRFSVDEQGYPKFMVNAEALPVIKPIKDAKNRNVWPSSIDDAEDAS